MVMKTAISIPDPIFEAAEKLAQRLGISRSQLYAKAVDTLVENYRYNGVRERLDAVYEVNPEAGKLDEETEKLQTRSITREKW